MLTGLARELDLEFVSLETVLRSDVMFGFAPISVTSALSLPSEAACGDDELTLPGSCPVADDGEAGNMLVDVVTDLGVGCLAGRREMK